MATRYEPSYPRRVYTHLRPEPVREQEEEKMGRAEKVFWHWHARRVRALNRPEDCDPGEEERATLAKGEFLTRPRIEIDKELFKRTVEFQARFEEGASLEAQWAERLFMEGVAIEGGVMDRETRREAGNWLDGGAFAYSPSVVDDVLHRTDALLMVPDGYNGRLWHSLAVDVVTGRGVGYTNKVIKDFERLHPEKYFASHAHWYDTRAKRAKENCDFPREGQIHPSLVTVCLPWRACQSFNDHPDERKAIEIMRDLGEFVRYQLGIILAFQFLHINGTLDVFSIENGVQGDMRGLGEFTRDQLIDLVEKRLDDLEGRSPTPRNQALTRLGNALQAVWNAQDRLGGSIPASLSRDVPPLLTNLFPLFPEAAEIYRRQAA